VRKLFVSAILAILISSSVYSQSSELKDPGETTTINSPFKQGVAFNKGFFIISDILCWAGLATNITGLVQKKPDVMTTGYLFYWWDLFDMGIAASNLNRLALKNHFTYQDPGSGWPCCLIGFAVEGVSIICIGNFSEVYSLQADHPQLIPTIFMVAGRIISFVGWGQFSQRVGRFTTNISPELQPSSSNPGKLMPGIVLQCGF
jgi:hypothetical protein